jgi:uncharacterized protein YndB with AHSA1/START domain
MEKQSFVIERTFDAPVSNVWRAITEVDLIRQWFWHLSGFRPEVGFAFRFESQPCKGANIHLCMVTEVVVRKKLAYTWRYEGYPGDSLVCFELFEEGKSTKLRMTHTGLETFPFNTAPLMEKKDFAGGWTLLIGTALKDLLENTTWSI